MPWNYRVVRSDSDDPDCPVLRITEVYYDKNMKPTSFVESITMEAYDDQCTVDVASHSDDRALENLRFMVKGMAEALDKPILDENKDFGEGGDEDEEYVT